MTSNLSSNKFKPFSLNLRGTLKECSRPLVMGILNATPDSFYSGSRTLVNGSMVAIIEKMGEDGVDIIDVGGCSTRQGSVAVSEVEEMRRVEEAICEVHKRLPGVIISVDTYRANVARRSVSDWGADIVNDISGGDADRDMWPTVAELKVPYVLMHMRGTPSTMQQHVEYEPNVVSGVVGELSSKLRQLSLCGVADVIVDPGFGFAKSLDQNYQLLEHLGELAQLLDKPLMVGVSRKSMATKLLGIESEQALNATTVLNTVALMQGASVLRVHDVKEAREAVTIMSKLLHYN